MFTATDTTADSIATVLDGIQAVSWFLAIWFVISLVSAILIARKAGYSHWLGVIAVMVPVVGPVLVLVFALLKWPALKQRDRALAVLEEKGIPLEAPDDAVAEEKPQIEE